MASIALIIMIGIFFLALPGLFIAMGIVIYKDAKAHSMHAGLWTAIAILVPNFIGIIIYLVVRSNQEKKYQCSNCNQEVQIDYNVCPNCQAIFGESCKTCKHTINSEMSYCPYCGNEVEIDETMPTAHKVTPKTNIVKPLAIIGGIFITLLIAMIFTLFVTTLVSNTTYTSPQNISVMTVETNMGNTSKASFKYKDDHSSIKVKKEIGDTLLLTNEINLTAGDIELTLLDPNGTSIYNKIYTDEILPETLPFPAEVAGKYTLEIKITAASGSYKITLD